MVAKMAGDFDRGCRKADRPLPAFIPMHIPDRPCLCRQGDLLQVLLQFRNPFVETAPTLAAAVMGCDQRLQALEGQRQLINLASPGGIRDPLNQGVEMKPAPIFGEKTEEMIQPLRQALHHSTQDIDRSRVKIQFGLSLEVGKQVEELILTESPSKNCVATFSIWWASSKITPS